MMNSIMRRGVVLAGILSTAILSWGQQHVKVSEDIAFTYVAERAKIVNTDCGCFWLQGGSADFAWTFTHGLGVAANLTGVHAGDIGTGLQLDKVLFAVGPRYTYSPKTWPGHRIGAASIFGEGLFGGVHGFNTTFPSPNGPLGAASSFAMVFGGGVDLHITKHIGIRAVEGDYIRTNLPNGATGEQNDLRLASGISFHFD
jgi:hypothetical protein